MKDRIQKRLEGEKLEPMIFDKTGNAVYINEDVRKCKAYFDQISNPYIGIYGDHGTAAFVLIAACILSGKTFFTLFCNDSKEINGAKIKSLERSHIVTITRECPFDSTFYPEIVDGPMEGDEYLSESRGNSVPFDFVFFTSGSTGIPKPVKGRLDTVVHFIENTFNLSPITGYETSISMLGFAFDGILRAYLMPIFLNGAVLPIGVEDCLTSGIKIDGPILLHTTPTILNKYCVIHSVGASSTQAKFLLGGENPNRLNFGSTKKCFPGSDLMSIYGATEMTLGKAISHSLADGFTGIGRIFNDTEITLSSTSEVIINSRFGTDGYLNVELNHGKFKFGCGEVVYMTGDVGEVLPSGEIRIVGRIDNSIKWNGKIVNLDELDHLLKTKYLLDVCVVFDEIVGLAYFSQQKNIDQIKELVRSHIVPSGKISGIESFPSSSIGKVDRAALVRLITKEDPALELNSKWSEFINNLEDLWNNKNIDADKSPIGNGADSLDIVLYHGMLNDIGATLTLHEAASESIKTALKELG